MDKLRSELLEAAKHRPSATTENCGVVAAATNASLGQTHDPLSEWLARWTPNLAKSLTSPSPRTRARVSAYLLFPLLSIPGNAGASVAGRALLEEIRKLKACVGGAQRVVGGGGSGGDTFDPLGWNREDRFLWAVLEVRSLAGIVCRLVSFIAFCRIPEPATPHSCR